MVGIELIGVESVMVRFQGAAERMRQALGRATMRLAVEAQRRVAGEKLSGGVLKVRTGRLRRSINVRPLQETARIGATVGTNVFYGRIWELTGLPARTVVPREKKALFWKGAAHPVRRAEIPALGPRPFLAVVLQEMRAQAREEISQAAKAAL